MNWAKQKPPSLLKPLLLSHEQRENFLKEAYDLFKRKRQGHLIHRCYLTPAALFYGGKFTSTPANYMRNGEISAIYNARQAIGKKTENPNGIIGIENGPGMETAMRNKSAPFFSSLPGLHTYVGRDYSSAALSIMQVVMEEELPSVRIIPDMSDFHKAALPEGLGTGRKVIAEFGMTTGNMQGFPEEGFPYAAVKANIATQKALMNPGGIYTFTFDCNQNGAEVEAAYNSEWTTLWGRELFRSMKEQLPIEGDFDPDSYDFRCIWNGSSHGGFNYMIAQRRMNFSLLGEDFTIEKGDGWGITNSYKMPEEMAEELASELDLEIDFYRSNDRRIAMPALIA